MSKFKFQLLDSSRSASWQSETRSKNNFSIRASEPFDLAQDKLCERVENLAFGLWHSALLKVVALMIAIFFAALWPVLGQGALIDDLKEQIEAKSKEIQSLEEEARKYQAEIKASQKEQNTLANQITQIANRITKLSLDIRLTEAKVAKTEFQIEQIALEIARRTEEIEGEKRTLAQAIRVLSAYDQEARLAVLLKNPTFSSFLDQVQYISNLQGEIQRKLESVKLLKASLEEEKSDLEAKRDELEDLRAQLDSQRQLSRDQRSERENLLKQTRNQEVRYQALLKDVRKRQIEIQQEIVDLEEKLRRAINPAGVPAARPGVLAWPLEGVLSQGYGPTSATGFINDGYQFHNGLDIAASFGSPVRAARDGTVVGVGDLGRWAYGRWVAIRHENGLTTLYAHLSLIAAQPGQQVQRGSIVGYEGSTGFSTGPHLHFTVYASDTFKLVERPYGVLPIGGSINPLDYLP